MGIETIPIRVFLGNGTAASDVDIPVQALDERESRGLGRKSAREKIDSAYIYAEKEAGKGSMGLAGQRQSSSGPPEREQAREGNPADCVVRN